MTFRFDHEVASAFTELRMIGFNGPVPVDDWAIEAPAALLPGVDLANRLRAADDAIEEGAVLFIEHAATARLTTHEATLLALPPLADVSVTIGTTGGNITRPDFGVTLVWKNVTGQPVVGAQRLGAWLRAGSSWRRLPDVLFDVAERIDTLNAVPQQDLAGRMAALAALRELLPDAEAAGRADASGAIGSMSIAVADAFSLDLVGEGDASRLVPILHRAGQRDGGPLLPEAQQRIFGIDRFNSFSTARSIYPLGAGAYVVLQPVLRAALAEVRRVQGESLATKRALLASPRAFLRSALGDETDQTVLESVFLETDVWSERVIGLGLWKPRVVPWVPLEANDWFDGTPGPGGQNRAPNGLMVNDRLVPLTKEQAEELLLKTEAAIGAGEASVRHVMDGEEIELPATDETRSALLAVQAALARRGGEARAKTEAEHVIIQPNEQSVEVEANWKPRDHWAPQSPHCLLTAMKSHQLAGLAWLQDAWRLGRPGVLLADDMGLGKTLQALAFLAWLREGMTINVISPAPVLIVAPTGLLENWREEHDRHLAKPGLGRLLRAYGKDLAQHRIVSADGQPGLALEALRSAEWVLTTYETLRDYDKDFLRVRFAAAVFDEAQKIKTPGIRLTDAAKSINAAFIIALTGTPVENRLSDLWCIVDTVHPGYLASLKEFSDRFERKPDPDVLRSLKDQLDRSRGGRPPLMLRRMRIDHLPDLPSCEERLLETDMPQAQREAYDSALEAARTAETGGGILAALAALRRISLHPFPDQSCSDQAFIESSARLLTLFSELDEVEQQGERSLIFVDDRAMQARLAGLIQRRYRLSAVPVIINGAVPGAARQAHVNKFQAAQSDFGVMLLSPRAGGVGLTLTSANHVFHLERWWNPAVEDQCTGRVLRIGQTRPVYVHIPQATYPGRRSFDQNLGALLHRKRQLVRETLGVGEMTEDEGRRLLQDTVS